MLVNRVREGEEWEREREREREREERRSERVGKVTCPNRIWNKSV